MTQLDMLDLLAVDDDRAALDALIAAGEQTGPANRERMVEAWRTVHGSYLAPTRREHPWWLWELAGCSPGGSFSADDCDQWRAENPGVHLPTTLTVDRRAAYGEDRDPTDIEAHIWYRAACLGCDWEGAPTTDENVAAEDAHDHTHPWWRDLPPVAKLRGDVTPAKREKLRVKVAAVYEEARPGCTDDPWCPTLTWRPKGQTRHHTGGVLGGWDLGVLSEEAS